MSSYGDRIGVIRSDDDRAAIREIDDGHGARLTRRQVKGVVCKHRPAGTRCCQHDLPRQDVGRDREPAMCLADLESGLRELEVALARQLVCHLLVGNVRV